MDGRDLAINKLDPACRQIAYEVAGGNPLGALAELERLTAEVKGYLEQDSTFVARYAKAERLKREEEAARAERIRKRQAEAEENQRLAAATLAQKAIDAERNRKAAEIAEGHRIMAAIQAAKGA